MTSTQPPPHPPRPTPPPPDAGSPAPTPPGQDAPPRTPCRPDARPDAGPDAGPLTLPPLDQGVLTLAVADGQVAYVQAGEGDLVVLLHGGVLDHRMWTPQLASLPATHRVVAADLRGHGRSSSSTTPARYCDDVAALIRHLGGRATLVGLSMGAGVAVDTALEHPDLISALVVMGAGTSEPEFGDPWLLGVMAEWDRAREALDLEAYLAAWDRVAAGPYRDVGDVDPALLAALREMATSTITTHLAAGPPRATPVRDTWNRLAGITCPVLGVIGGGDSDDHVGMVERLVRSVPDGRTATVGGTAHYPNLERPGYVDALLRDFLITAGRVESPVESTPGTRKSGAVIASDRPDHSK